RRTQGEAVQTTTRTLCARQILLREQVLHLLEDEDDRGSQGHQDHRRENQKEYREDQLHAHLARLFLSDLPEADPQVAGVGLEGRTEAGAEAVGIDQQVGELAQFQVSAAVGKILQRFGARGVGLQFQVELSEL